MFKSNNYDQKLTTSTNTCRTTEKKLSPTTRKKNIQKRNNFVTKNIRTTVPKAGARGASELETSSRLLRAKRAGAEPRRRLEPGTILGL